jgi:hypothetical protein
VEALILGFIVFIVGSLLLLAFRYLSALREMRSSSTSKEGKQKQGAKEQGRVDQLEATWEDRRNMRLKLAIGRINQIDDQIARNENMRSEDVRNVESLLDSIAHEQRDDIPESTSDRAVNSATVRYLELRRDMFKDFRENKAANIDPLVDELTAVEEFLLEHAPPLRD